MKFKDERLKIMNEILNGIKVGTSIHIYNLIAIMQLKKSSVMFFCFFVFFNLHESVVEP